MYLRWAVRTVALLVCLAALAADEKAAAPLRHAHAHNDYQHKRPLLDALDQGFGSVESDVFLDDTAEVPARPAGGRAVSPPAAVG
jgi:hypothetical protein